MKVIYLIGIIALLGAMMVIPVSATTETFSSVKDTWLDEFADGGNCDEIHEDMCAVSWANKNNRALIQFDVSSIPSGVTIDSATVHLYKLYVSENRINDIHRVTASWTESETTWNSRYTGTLWTTPGGDYVSTPTDSPSTGTTFETWMEWDVTSDVQDFVDGTPNDGWLIKDATEGASDWSGAAYATREIADPLRPYLEVTYTEGAADPDLTPTSIATDSLSAGVPAAITVNVSNIGSAEAGSFNVTLKVEETVIGSDTVASLGAGSSVPVVFTWTPDAAGSFNLTAIADSDDAVAESDEANNGLTREVTVTPAAATTVTLSPDGDVHVAIDTPDANCDTIHDILSVWSWTGHDKRSLVHFDLSSVPSGATIDSATLHLYIKDHVGVDRTHNIHRVMDSWTKTGVTWNSQPSYESTLTDSASIGTTAGVWVQWDITSDGQAFVDGTPNYGWLIKDETESGSSVKGANYYSLECTDPTLRPYLEVTYTEGAADPDLTPTSIATDSLSAGVPAAITVDVSNIGTAAAGQFNVSLKVEDTVIGSDTVTSLDAGSSVPVVFTWTPDAAGSFNLTAIVDSDDAVAESDEANNGLTEEVTISEGSGGLADTPWPMFGHDLQHTGVSPYIGVQEPTVKWSVQTSTSGGGVSAQPVIDSDGTIYIGTVACDQGKFYAFNPDGTEKWTFSPVVEGSGCPGCNEFWGSAAIAADGTIYVGWCSCYGPGGIAGEGMLYALDSDDGSVKWQFGMVPYRCSSSSTIGADGIIYWGAGNKIYAVNPDGTEKWNFTTTADEKIRDAAIGADGTIYAASRDHNLYAINPDGTEKWHFETGDKIYFYPVVGSDGTIYVGSRDHNLYAINPDGSMRWQFDTGERVLYLAIGLDGTIYVSAGNTLWAINPDGTEKWHFTTGGMAKSPAIGADGTIYFGSYDKNFYALNPDGTEKWRITTDYEIGGSPAIGADGTIYVPSGKAMAGAGASRLYAIGQSTPTPPTSFLISGNITYDNGNPVMNPAVTVTNLATSEDFTVKTDAGSNYYLTLTDSTHVTAGDTIRINASDGTVSNETDHPVTAFDLETGGFVHDMTIESGELPDLTVTEKSEEWISLADGTYNVTCTVANIGTSGADASTTAIEIDGTVVATDPVPALAIGESHTSTLGPFTLSGENDTIRVCADSGEIINEQSETNNCLENVLEAPSMPDLIVWVALKTPGYVNEDNILGVRVKNTGTGDAGSFNVSLAIDGTQVPEQTVPPLSAGETTEIEYAWTPTELGGHLLSATVDTNNDVEESDETNNDYARTSVIISSTDWAQFNYDATGIGFSPSSAPSSNTVKWISEDIVAGGGLSWGGISDMGPVVAGGKIFTYCGVGGVSATTYDVACVNEETGELLWNITLPYPMVYGSWAPLGYDDGMVFCTVNHYVVALDADDGSIVWECDLDSPEFEGHAWSVNSGPTIADGMVFAGTYDEGGIGGTGGLAGYVAIDEYTGEKLWQTTGDGHCDSTPAYYDGVVYAGFDYDWTASPSGGCYALNASTGEEVWTTWLPFSIWGSVSVDEDYVYGANYNFYGPAQVFILYRNNGTVKVISESLRTDSTPAVAYDNIYICGGCQGYSDTGTFCVDKETLEVIWSAPAGSWTASPAVADGKVYVGGFCYDAFTGEEIFSYEQGGLSPVIANGCLFNVQNGRVVCFGGAIMMDIGDYVVLEDSSIVAPITIYGITDYGTTTMQLEYDSSIAWVTSVDGTPDSTVSSVNINNPAGIVTLSAWDTDGVSGDVAIANVTLEARGPGGSTTALDLTVITLKDTSYNEIPAYDGDGSFTVKESVPPVVGSPQSSPDVILNDNGRAMVPGTNLTTLSVSVTDNSVIASVTIDLTPIGGNAAAEMTPAGGTMWSVTVNATSGIDESHCLTVNATDMSGNSNTDVCIPLTVLRRGDVVRDNSVDIVDAYYIARYSVGLEPKPDEFVAGVIPVDSWDGVDIVDAYYIARHSVGLEDAP